MKSNAQPRVKIRMKRHDYQQMRAFKPGTTLFCDAGILWVTQAGDQQDYVLQPGQKMIVTKPGKVLVEAMRDADFHVA
jgi:hypothetical protein